MDIFTLFTVSIIVVASSVIWAYKIGYMNGRTYAIKQHEVFTDTVRERLNDES